MFITKQYFVSLRDNGMNEHLQKLALLLISSSKAIVSIYKMQPSLLLCDSYAC